MERDRRERSERDKEMGRDRRRERSERDKEMGSENEDQPVLFRLEMRSWMPVFLVRLFSVF